MDSGNGSGLASDVQALIAYRKSGKRRSPSVDRRWTGKCSLGLVVRCGQGTEGLGITGSQDGSTSAADELEHAASHGVFSVAASLRDADVSLGETDYVWLTTSLSALRTNQRFADQSSSRTSTLLRT